MNIISRREALKAVGGGAVLSSIGFGAAAKGRTEIETMEALVGRSWIARDAEGSARVTLEQVVPLTPRVRPPFAAGRAPYALVFRQEDGAPLTGDVLFFDADGLGSGTDLLVSIRDGDDGARRLEAVFN